MKRALVIFIIAFLIVFSLAACAQKPTPAQELIPVTVQLKYLHQAQFAGFYAADQNGYYTVEGLKVTFIQGEPSMDLELPVIDGTAQFGVTGAEKLIIRRAEGDPLQAIAVIYRRNPLVFMSLADSNITQPQDIVGKKVQYNATTYVMLNAMLANIGISPDAYQVVDVGYDLIQLFSGKVQIWNAFIINEVQTAIKEGYNVNLIYPDDYGIHFYSDTIFTKDETITNNPDLVLRFLRATLKGWTYAIENPVFAAEMVSKYNPKADLQHETNMMNSSIPLVNTGEDYIGWMNPNIWAGMEQVLREQGLLIKPLDISQVYTTKFLEEIYK